MDRLRRSFRRKKHKDLSSDDERGVGLDTESTGAVQELGPAGSLDEPEPIDEGINKEKPGRLARLRQSFRRKKKKGKDSESKDENIVVCEPAETLDIQPFDKRSKFRRTLSFRKKKKKKPTKFESDEENVRNSRCSFNVKYLGSVEVEESRGMEVCEAAIKELRKGKKDPVSTVLHVSGDGLRVVEKKGSGMIVDQVIEKVSFCSPDRNCDKGFAYICRDGTTRRWLCHCFLSKEDSGERLSHAVGVAFSICLERKQQREADCGVSMSYNETDGTFTKFGSFRQGTIHERIQDPQNFKAASPPPPKTAEQTENPYAVARPHVSDLMFQRQASFKGLGQLSGSSPFKRDASQYSSLRETRLPSNIERKQKSRISLILEENFEDESLKNDIDKLMTEMATENMTKKNNNNSLTKNINTLEAFDLKPLSTSQTFPGAQSSLQTFDLNPQPQTSTPLQYIPSHGTSPNPSLSSGLGLATASPHLGQSTGVRLGSDLTGGSLEVSLDMSQTSRGIGASPYNPVVSVNSTVSAASPVLNFTPAVPVSVPGSDHEHTTTSPTLTAQFNNHLGSSPVLRPALVTEDFNGNEDTGLTNGLADLHLDHQQQEHCELGDEKNPWDLVPDQSKIKQHSRSNSKVDGMKENAAENWLASLTSKIVSVPDNESIQGFTETPEEEDIDSQFVELANRNKIKSTNPFRAYV